MAVPSFNVVHIHNKLATRLGFCTAINDNDHVNWGHRGHWNLMVNHNQNKLKQFVHTFIRSIMIVISKLNLN